MTGKSRVPVEHAETGQNFSNYNMSEEANTVTADYVSSTLFVPSELSTRRLARKGVRENVRREPDSCRFRRHAERVNFRRVPCVKLWDEAEWVELVETGWNRLCPPTAAIVDAFRDAIGSREDESDFYGSGQGAVRIADILGGQNRGREW